MKNTEGYKETSFKPWSKELIVQWYMNSIDNTIDPIWAEAHIREFCKELELCKDFIVIKRCDAIS